MAPSVIIVPLLALLGLYGAYYVQSTSVGMDFEKFFNVLSKEMSSELRANYEFETAVSSRLRHQNIPAFLLNRSCCGKFEDDALYMGHSAWEYIMQAWRLIEDSVVDEDCESKSIFISTIFSLGSSFNAEQAALKASGSRPRKEAGKNAARKSGKAQPKTPQRPWPKVFENPLMREAFTLCASALSALELGEILIHSWELYFPLMVCNHEAASAFVTWPDVSGNWLPRIFDFSRTRFNSPAFSSDSAGPDANVNAANVHSLKPLVAAHFTQLQSLGLDVFKLPRFLQQAQPAVLRDLIERYACDLLPPEYETLTDLRGLQSIFDELKDLPCAWTMLRTILSIAGETAHMEEPDDLGKSEVQMHGAEDDHTPASSKKAATGKASKKKLDQKALPLAVLSPLRSFDLHAKFAYMIDTDLLISRIVQHKACAEDTRLLIVACVQHWVVCEFYIRRCILALSASELPPEQRDELEGMLVRVLEKSAKLVKCFRADPSISYHLPQKLIFPLSSRIRTALYSHLKLSNCCEPEARIVTALCAFVEGNPEMALARKALLDRYAGRVRDPDNCDMEDEIYSWLNFFLSFGISWGPTAMSWMLLVLDDIPQELVLFGQIIEATPDFPSLKLRHMHYQRRSEFIHFALMYGENSCKKVASDPWYSGDFQGTLDGHPLLLDSVFPLKLMTFMCIQCPGVMLALQYSSFNLREDFDPLSYSIVQGRLGELGVIGLDLDNLGLKFNGNLILIDFKYFAEECSLPHFLPVGGDAQLKALNCVPRDELVQYFHQMPTLRSLKGLELDRLPIEYDRLLYALHTVPERLLLDWCHKQEGVFNYPEQLITMCSTRMYSSAEFMDFVWENPAASVLLLVDRVFSDSLNLPQVMVVMPLQCAIGPDFHGEALIMSYMWRLIKYLVMQDYAFCLYNVVTSIVGIGDENAKRIRSVYLDTLGLEIQTRQSMRTFLKMIHIDNGMAVDAESTRLIQDLKWMVGEGNWTRQISPERLNFVGENYQALLDRDGQLADNEVLKEWLEMRAAGSSGDMNRLKPLLNMIVNYAPSLRLAYVWRSRLRICWAFALVSPHITAATQFLSFDTLDLVVPKSKHASIHLPNYDRVVSVKTTQSKAFRKKVLTEITKKQI